MGTFSDIEIKILDRLTEVVDGELESIGYENSEKDRMLYSTCINDDEKELKDYKSSHAEEWSAILGGTDFDVVEESYVPSDSVQFTAEPE